MKVVRQIVYESESQDALDIQLHDSSGDGMKEFHKRYGDKWLPEVVKITVRTLHDERVKMDLFPDETAKVLGIPTVDSVRMCHCNICHSARARRALDEANKAAQARIEAIKNGSMDAMIEAVGAGQTGEQITVTGKTDALIEMEDRPDDLPSDYHPSRQDEAETTEGAN